MKHCFVLMVIISVKRHLTSLHKVHNNITSWAIIKCEKKRVKKVVMRKRIIKGISNNKLHVKAREKKHNRESSRIIHRQHTCTGDWGGGGGGG